MACCWRVLSSRSPIRRVLTSGSPSPYSVPSMLRCSRARRSRSALGPVGCRRALRGRERSAGLVSWPEPFRPQYGLVAGGTFLIAAVIVAFSANRLNSAFEVYEKSQISAYRHLIEHVQDAVMRFSPDGQVLFASRSSEKLFGCRRYELSGGGMVERIHVLDRPDLSDRLRGRQYRRQGAPVEVRMRKDDPERAGRVPRFIWVEAASRPSSTPACGRVARSRCAAPGRHRAP